MSSSDCVERGRRGRAGGGWLPRPDLASWFGLALAVRSGRLRFPPARRRHLRVHARSTSTAPTATPLVARAEARARRWRHARSSTPPPKRQVILDISGVNDDKQVLSLSERRARTRIPADEARDVRAARRERPRLDAGRARSSSAAPTRSTSPKYSRARHRRRGCCKEMQTDAVQQIVRRLQTAKKPA